jgi:hypothetical protein
MREIDDTAWNGSRTWTGLCSTIKQMKNQSNQSIWTP